MLRNEKDVTYHPAGEALQPEKELWTGHHQTWALGWWSHMICIVILRKSLAMSELLSVTLRSQHIQRLTLVFLYNKDLSTIPSSSPMTAHPDHSAPGFLPLP